MILRTLRIWGMLMISEDAQGFRGFQAFEDSEDSRGFITFYGFEDYADL